MPATITTGAPRGPEKRTHEEACDLGVDESGALIVTAREGKGEWVVAVYAAGAWLHAEIT